MSDVAALESSHHEPRDGSRVTTQAANMRETLTVLDRLARTDLAITIVGETGTGKSRLARAVHEASPRAKAAIVVLDFGSATVEPTGLGDTVSKQAPDLFSRAIEEAHGGTLLINEAAELPLEQQSRLVRALESQRMRRNGALGDAPLDARVLVTTARDLEREAHAGRLREDLYFRLAAAVVRVPPLRERREDIPRLIVELLKDLGREDVTVSSDTVAFLQAQPWRGNVRELKNTLAYALALLEGTRLELRDFERLGAVADASPLDHLSLAGISLEDLERTAIRQTLARVQGNKVRAAKSLRIAVSTLYEKLKRLSID